MPEQTSSTVERALKLQEGSVLASEVLRLRADVERLRARTHEIQAQEMAKRAALDSELAEWRTRWLAAKTWSEQVGLTADWAIDPTLPFWRMTSEATRCALMALVAQRDEAQAEAERLQEECNATADSALELAAQRDAALSDCRDLQREVELLRGQVGSWDSAQAVWDAIGRIRKSLGGDTDG